MGHSQDICLVKEKKIFMRLVDNDKNDFHSREDRCNRYGDHCNGVLEWRREMGLNSEYSKGDWEFIAKEEGGGGVLNGRKHQE